MTPSELDGLCLRRRRVQEVLELEAAQVRTDGDSDAGTDRRAVRGHELVEDDEGIGDRFGVARRQTDRAEDVDVLAQRKSTPEVGSAQCHSRELERLRTAGQEMNRS